MLHKRIITCMFSFGAVAVRLQPFLLLTEFDPEEEGADVPLVPDDDDELEELITKAPKCAALATQLMFHA
jgi:hypothetical protein